VKGKPAKHAKHAKMKNKVNDLLFKDECYAIIGGCFAVYKDKGCGFLEPVYQECLEIEFEHLKIPAVLKPQLTLSYRGRTLRQIYQPDFICLGKIVVELKAASALADEHRAQLINYLNATGHQLGLLVNFGHYPNLEWERIVNTRQSRSATEGTLPKDFSL
jgi:GxxExxY protein